MHKILAPLNKEQRTAVEALNGPVLILAGAGSGKTKTLVHRIAYLIEYKGIKPQHILAVTFTNKAAKEMKDRVRKLLGKSTKIIPIMGTFHAICVQILRREIHHLEYNKNFVIFDDRDSLYLIKKILKDIGFDQNNLSPKAIAILISRAKNELQSAGDYDEAFGHHNSLIEKITSQVYARYQSELKEHNALDFDDLIMKVVELFRDFPEVLAKYQKAFQYILVDEYQDTNKVQYLLIQMLAQKHKNLCVVGDDFQAIYGWRGANMKNILNFEKDYPQANVVLLEQNYRSTKNIIAASNEIIKYNITQKEKKLWTDNPSGSKITVHEAEDEKGEGEFIVRSILDLEHEKKKKKEDDKSELTYELEEPSAPQSILDRIMQSETFSIHRHENLITDEIKKKIKITDFSEFVVLYRTNAQSRAIEESCLKYGIPYRVIGGIKFYDRKEVRDIMSYLRVLVNPDDWVSLERVCNEPPRGLGKVSWQKIEATCREKNKNILTIATDELPKIQTKSLEAFFQFQKIIQYLHQQIADLKINSLIDLIAEKTGYKKVLQDGSRENLSRWENIMELKTVAQKHSHLKGIEAVHAFLEEISLSSDQDEVDENAKAVNLMTIHAAKGLEFKNVFVVGMEEGLFPHSRSLFEPEEMEEERRLCYVAITRAKTKLYMIYASERTIYGSTQANKPSRFLGDLPKELIS
ncbi:MAG: UvrD-helicase domain-containing protein [Patescibacteria group bacterium]